jgi:hypothetical protein
MLVTWFRENWYASRYDYPGSGYAMRGTDGRREAMDHSIRTFQEYTKP